MKRSRYFWLRDNPSFGRSDSHYNTHLSRSLWIESIPYHGSLLGINNRELLCYVIDERYDYEWYPNQRPLGGMFLLKVKRRF